MRVYRGSCHCGKVRFEAEMELARVTRCNCSICRKKGAVLHRVLPEHFKLLSGEEELVLYRFNKKVAKHYFCGTCGIQPFSRPRAAPEQYVVNVNCLDDYDLEAEAPEEFAFDGRNWEASVAALKSG